MQLWTLWVHLSVLMEEIHDLENIFFQEILDYYQVNFWINYPSMCLYCVIISIFGVRLFRNFHFYIKYKLLNLEFGC